MTATATGGFTIRRRERQLDISEHLAPVGNRVLFENDAIRVWLVDVAAGDELALHLHENPYLLVNLTDGRLAVHDANGEPVERTLTGETVEWHDAGELHSFTNVRSPRGNCAAGGLEFVPLESAGEAQPLHEDASRHTGRDHLHSPPM